MPNIADFCSQFILGAFEYVLTARGVPKITIHQFNVGIGATIQSATLLVFGFAKSPVVATAAACGNKICHNMVGSWLSQSYMEIGGDDSGALKAYGTTACNLATMVLPYFGAFSTARAGSLRLFYVTLSAVHVLGASVIVAFMTTKTARELLIKSRAPGRKRD
jgi:hypothetical protein